MTKKATHIKVSVITPIYKTEEYLEKCLASLVSQTLDDMEFIWIDNGSSENCKKIIKKYAQQRANIKTIYLDENIGYCGALNSGLEEACGEYIGFCDSDDWVDNDYYEKLYLAAQKSDADIAYTEYIEEYCDGTNKRMPHIGKPQELPSLYQKFELVRHGSIWDKIYRRKFIVANNIQLPNSPISYYQDNNFLIPALIHANTLVLINNVLYHYRIVETSTIRDESTLTSRQKHSILLAGELLKLATQYNFDHKEKKAYLQFILRSLSLPYIIKKNKKLLNEIKEINKIEAVDSFFTKALYNIYSMYHPSILQRIFSVHAYELGYIVYCMGFKITLKTRGIR